MAVNRVGVVPKSLSGPNWDAGTCQNPINARLDALSCTTAYAIVSGGEQPPIVPVVKYRVPLLASTVSDPHTPPPPHPLATTWKVFWMAPVDALIRKTCPCVNGLSQSEAVDI